MAKKLQNKKPQPKNIQSTKKKQIIPTRSTRSSSTVQKLDKKINNGKKDINVKKSDKKVLVNKVVPKKSTSLQIRKDKPNQKPHQKLQKPIGKQVKTLKINVKQRNAKTLTIKNVSNSKRQTIAAVVVRKAIKPPVQAIKNKISSQKVLGKPRQQSIPKKQLPQKQKQNIQAKQQLKDKKQVAKKLKVQPIQKQVKQKKEKKKVLKVVDPEKEAMKLEKQRIKELRKIQKEQKMAAKLEKAKNFHIIPREDIPLVTYNSILEKPPLQHQDNNQDIPSQQQKKQNKSKIQQDIINDMQPQRVFENQNCCIFCNSRELIQCIKYDDVEGFENLLKSYDTISNPYQRYSVDCYEDILKAAINSPSDAFLKIILNYEEENKKKPEKRVKLPSISLEKIGTGQPNKMQFYFPIRQVQLSRGGKEGNNAFLHDKDMRAITGLELQDVFDYEGLNLNKLNIIQTFNQDKFNQAFLRGSNEINMLQGKILRTGNFALIKYMIGICTENEWSYGFNKLHTSAILQGDQAKEIKSITKAKLLRKSLDFLQITPMHIAAVNPDPTVFKMYFKYYPQSSVIDIEQRDLVHYAAANQNSEVLQFLIQKKCEVNNQDISGITPLMIACRLGRLENVKYILEEQARVLQSLDPESEDYGFMKQHSTFTYTQSKKYYTPLHYAAQNGHIQIVKALIEDGEATIDMKTSKSKTPLLLACENGHLEVVKYLLEKGAKPHGDDKQGKSPLIVAIINGHLHVVSYLLRFGVNPNYKDLSENSAIHYACAYGWLHIVKYLIEVAGADPNCVNEWKMSPILLAMLKGHFGIVDYMINQKQINASFQDDQGRTLISQLMMNLNEESYKNLQFLLDKSKIDCTLKDNDGLSPLHHLASNDLNYIVKMTMESSGEVRKQKTRYIMRKGKKIKIRNHNNNRHRYINYPLQGYNGFFDNIVYQEEYDQLMYDLKQNMMDCALLLFKQGARIDDKCSLGDITPIFFAVQFKNYQLAEWMLKQYPNAISGQLQRTKENILHLLAQRHFNYEKNLLKFLLNTNPKIIQDMIYQRDHKGFHPFHHYFDTLTQHKHIFDIQSKSSQTQTYIRNVILPRINENLIQACQIYINNFNYDMNEYTGIPQNRLDKLNILKKNQLIDEDLYNTVVDMKYDLEKYYQEKNKKRDDKQSKNQEELDFNEVQENQKLQNMGLFKIENIAGHQNQYQQRQNYKRIQKVNGHFNINENTESYEFDIFHFYGDENTMKTIFHKFVEYSSYFKTEYDIVLATEPLATIIDIQKKHQDSYQNCGFNKFNLGNRSAIQEALKSQLFRIVKIFMAAKVVDYNQQGYNTGLCFLHYMAQIKNKEFLDYFFTKYRNHDLNQTVFLNATDKNGNTMLHYACNFRNEFLVEQLAKVKLSEFNSQNKYGMTPLHFSLYAYNEKLDHTPQIERILLSVGADLNLPDKNGRLPIFYLFEKFNKQNQQVVKDDPANLTILLTQSGKIKNINHQDKYGQTALHYACKNGSTISALTLINAGADITIKNTQGNTAFGVSLENKHADLSTFLIQNGSDVNQDVVQLKNKQNAINDLKPNLRKLILPRKLYDEYITEKDKTKITCYKDYLEQNFKLTVDHPFYHALSNNQNGMSYLMLSKQADLFYVLVSCVKTNKFQKFKDFLLHNEDKDLPNKYDKKGKNLLMLFVKYCEDFQDEVKWEIFNLLLDKKYTKDILHCDKNSKNILHMCGKNVNKFQKIYNSLYENQKWQLLKQKETKRLQSPLVYLFTKQKIQDSHINFLKTIDFKKLNHFDLTFTSLKDNSQLYNKITTYMPQNELSEKECNKKERHLYYQFLIGIQNQGISSKDKNQLIRKLIQEVKLDFNIRFNNYTPIQQAIVANQRDVIDAFLGYSYDDKSNLIRQYDPLVNINIKDVNGRNLLILGIQPNKYGTYQNIDVIEKLLQAGLDPKERDNSKQDSYDYAKGNELIMKALNKFEQQKDKTAKLSYHLTNKDLITNSKLHLTSESERIIQETFIDNSKPEQNNLQQNFDFEQDADKYIQQLRQKLLDEQMQIDNDGNHEKAFQPDEVGKFENCEIVRDQNQDILYDVVMTKIDVKKGFYGICNFYLIQLLYDKIKDMHILWTRWGRIGAQGQYQRTPFTILQDAIKEFNKVYKQKTGSNWSEFDKYSPIPGKYVVKRRGGVIIHIRKQGKQAQISKSIRQFQASDYLIDFDTLNNCAPSHLTITEKKFIKPLVNQAYLFRRTISTIKKELFLECLFDKDQLTDMRKILNKLKFFVTQKDQAQKQKDFAKFQDVMEKLYKLTNKYYEIVNPTQFADQSFQVLQYPYQISTEEQKLQAIYDLEMVTKLLFAAAYKSKVIHPLDYCFNQFKVKLVPLKLDQDEEYTLLLKYLNNSYFEYHKNNNNKTSALTVQNVFSVIPKDHEKKYCVGDYYVPKLHDKDDFFKKLHNHYMLFHGTKNANVLSILGNGLQIAPQNSASINGHSFGKGIYLADQASKSIHYCENDGKSDLYLLVVEAALGNVVNSLGMESFTSKDLEGYHSLRVMSSQGPDFNQNLVRKDGTIWPLGQIINYPIPTVSYHGENFKNLKEMVEFQEKQKENLQKEELKKQENEKLQNNGDIDMTDVTSKKNGKNVKKGRFNKNQDKQLDVEMIDTSTKSSNRQVEEVNEEKMQKPVISEKQLKEGEKIIEQVKEKLTLNMKADPYYAHLRLEPNVVNYRKVHNEAQLGDLFRYALNQSEYIVYDPRQIRVRYVIHMKYKDLDGKTKKEEDSDDE